VKLVLSQRFRDEFRQQIGYIKSRNPAAAQVVRTRIVKAIRRLAQFPEAGRSWRLEGCRELIIPGLPYLVIYKVTADSVIVASLFHESREVPHVH
jgi:toxin ParE1/3/4